MYLKRYRRPTVREALAAVKSDLGPDALVLSTELVAADGWRGVVGAREVQITAAAERRVSDRRLAVSPARPAPQDMDGVTARLVAAGVDRGLAEAVAAVVPAADRRHVSDERLRELLAGQLAALTSNDDAFARVEVFVGPPGVGKTTTIAKLAARERAGRGRSLGMVAADGFRAGAVEQLRAYAHIIGAPFKVARTPGELDRVLTQSRCPTLVDTAGRSPRAGASAELLEVLERRRGVRTHLVIAADTSAASARRIFDAYERACPQRLVITKLDEADTMMPLLSVARERRLPVSFLTNGQQVPEDITRATPAHLARALLRDITTPASEEIC